MAYLISLPPKGVMASHRKFYLGLVQMVIGKNKAENLIRAEQLISQAKAKGANIIVLPECFNCPYGTKYFDEYAEAIPGGETCKKLSEIAKANQVFLVGGSIPERKNNKLYNTSTVWSPAGDLITQHRKIHLFDIDVSGGITFKESDVLSPGDVLTVFETPFCKIGLGICYDMRFPELSLLYRKAGADVILFPAAFNMTTGPLHWELILRSRAVDNQVFVAGVSGSRDLTADYVAWGNSTLVDPWGKIIVKAADTEEVLVGEVDLESCTKVRQQIPAWTQKRHDIYETLLKVPPPSK